MYQSEWRVNNSRLCNYSTYAFSGCLGFMQNRQRVKHHSKDVINNSTEPFVQQTFDSLTPRPSMSAQIRGPLNITPKVKPLEEHVLRSKDDCVQTEEYSDREHWREMLP